MTESTTPRTDSEKLRNIWNAYDYEERLDAMVARFLSWKLPEDFGPDCGIAFNRLPHPNSWPVGTNLLTAIQARAMLEHVIGDCFSEPVDLLGMAEHALTSYQFGNGSPDLAEEVVAKLKAHRGAPK